MSTATLGEALNAAQQRIDALDARVLMAHVTHRDTSYLISHPETPLNPEEERAYAALVERRAQGEPVAYITGEREFYGRTFKVTPAVLIPRPETEVLVDAALERVTRDGPAKVLDLGTGSGCVAVAIAAERPRAKVLAVDRSTDALAVARRNAVELRVGNVAFLESDWFEALRQDRFDVIVSNPPYVASGDPHLSRDDVRFEPRHALEAGADGLDYVRRIIREALAHLAPGGWLLIEHGHDQADRAQSLMLASGYGEIFSAVDLAGVARVVGGRLTLTAGAR